MQQIRLLDLLHQVDRRENSMDRLGAGRNVLYKKIGKRAIDLVLSGIAILCLLLPMLVVAIAIKLDTKGPAFFLQKRFGQNKRFFTMIKFRTMPMEAPHNVPTDQLKDGDVQLTKLEAFLRQSSVDELPQLFNIFAGQMSFVGPRPALWNQEDLIAERDNYGANELRPGLTGLAQINGRDELSTEKKAFYDGEYAKRISFIFDCKCIYNTVSKVIRHEGVHLLRMTDEKERSANKDRG